MNFIIYTLISAFILGLFEFFKRVSLKKSSPEEILYLYTFIALILSIFIVRDLYSSTIYGILLSFVKASVLYVGWGLSVRVLKKLDLGVVTSFGFLSSAFTFILSSIIFGE